MRNQTYIIVISLLISALLIFFWILPKYPQIVDSKNQVEQKKVELQKYEETLKDLQEKSEKLKEYEEALLKIDSALPLEPYVAQLLNFIQQVAGQSGLSLKSVCSFNTTETTIKEEKIKETKIDLTLSGSYPALKNFLSVIEKSARLIEVDKVSFSSPKEPEQKEQKVKEKKEKKEQESYDFKLTIKVYSY